MDGVLKSVRVVAALHDRAKRGELQGPELAEYLGGRDALMHLLLTMQRTWLEPGEKFRRFLRVALEVPATLILREQVIQTTTLNVSAGGFAIASLAPLEVGQEVEVLLALSGGSPLRARARVVHAARSRDGSDRVRVGFELLDLSEADFARLQTFVFDVVLERLRE